jgi:transcriptional regulator with XRE-family HTH domain
MTGRRPGASPPPDEPRGRTTAVAPARRRGRPTSWTPSDTLLHSIKANTKRRRHGRRPVAIDGPDPIDVYVGARLRERRVSLGMSQTTLAERMGGLSFQQLQKYERGTNRLSASALWYAAEAVDVPVSYFFDGIGRHALPPDPTDADVVVLKLTQKMRKLDPAVRDKISALIAVLVHE